MSLPPNPLPEEIAPVPAAPLTAGNVVEPPVDLLPPPRKSFPPWSGLDVLAICIFSAICIFVFLGVGLVATGFLAAPKSMTVTQLARDAHLIRIFMGAQSAAYLAILGCIFVVVRSRAATSFSTAIQWNWPGMGGLKYFAGGIVLALAVDLMSHYLPMPKSLPMEDLFTNKTNAYLLAVFGLTLAPLMEELFFRGLLYPVLRRATGLVAAVLLTGAAFAAIHGTQLGYAWAPLLSIFIVGIVFTVVREKLNSVASSFVMHCGYNFTLFSMLWFVSDHFRHLEKVTG